MVQIRSIPASLLRPCVRQKVAPMPRAKATVKMLEVAIAVCRGAQRNTDTTIMIASGLYGRAPERGTRIRATTNVATTEVIVHNQIATFHGNSATGRSSGKLRVQYGEGIPRFAGSVPSTLSVTTKCGRTEVGHRAVRTAGA